MYRVDIDSAHRLVTVTLRGFLTIAEAEAYMAELRTAHARTPALRGDFRMLLDLRDAMLPSREVLAVFRERHAALPHASRLALVTASALTRLQARRAIPHPALAFFDTPEAARAWLLE
ncbi:STAS/SEC14 domain-containing protein [Sphingomonas sp. ac-8]|uniref:STAS/SEC14 domain-containing protein n=1 Tax=Sphingomonas sp. ac-8 TaxID=3242977 RepID=UPI003A80483F